MNCPVCGGELREGYVKAATIGKLLPIHTSLEWFPEETRGKWFPWGVVPLKTSGEGRYCEACGKVFAVLEHQ